MKLWVGLFALMVLSAVSSPAATLTFIANGPAAPGLSPLNENPPHPESAATGTALVIWDTVTSMMTVNVVFSGLTTPDTAAHIHCCTSPPENAGVATQVPSFVGFPLGVMSGAFMNTFDMLNAASYNPAFVTAHGGTAASAAAVLLAGMVAGQTYLNIHTTQFPGGEIRGFLSSGPVVDFDGDGVADKAVFRPGTGTFGTWYVRKSNGSGDLAVQWGASGDVPVAGNYTGDARADFAVFRPFSGTWYVLSAEGASQPPVQWGAFGDVAVPGQYGGDSRTDFAVWRPTNGTWYVRMAEGTMPPSVQWGTAGDIPVPGDYDGDGVTDMAVFRPSNGTWYVRFSGGGTAAIGWGASRDIPVAADFTGDGRSDYGIYRSSTGTWYVKSSATLTELPSVAWGAFGDVPLPAQMAGDSRADNVVWRPSDGSWYVRSAEGLLPPAVPWGTLGDIPLAR